MNSAKIAAVVALPLLVSGCQAMVWGQLSAVFASALVFAGTLALGRVTEARAHDASERAPAASKTD
jgi:hypothetical protein